MVKDLLSIIELRQILEQKSRLSEREAKLAKAYIEDYAAISRVKDLFCEKIKDINKPYNRKKLLFVMLYLFAPRSLVGCRLPNGLRTELTRIFPDVSPCVISNDISDLFFRYQHYKDFRTEVESVCEYILERLSA